MPERDFTRTAYVTTYAGAVEQPSMATKTLGQYQSISALNYGAPFPKPGIWVCKPVTIIQSYASGSPLPKQIVKYGSLNYSIEGDTCAIHAGIKGFKPPYTILYDAPAWSNLREAEAINKAYSKIMAADLEVGVMIGELRETIEGIRNPLSGLRNFLKKGLRGKGGSPGKDFVSMLSSSWLEWRYGIRPLIQSIQDIYEHVNSEISSEYDGKIHRKRGRAPEVHTSRSVTERVQFADWQLEHEFGIDVYTRYNASVGYKLTAPLTWEEQYGLDAYSLPAIAWELTTLSFVVDWWFGFGKWLESLKTLNPKVQVLGLSTSMKTTVTVDACTTGKAWGPGMIPYTLNGRSSFGFAYERLIRKCPNTAFAGVTPSVNSKAFDLNRSIDALTLIWQRTAKGR